MEMHSRCIRDAFTIPIPYCLAHRLQASAAFGVQAVLLFHSAVALTCAVACFLTLDETNPRFLPRALI